MQNGTRSSARLALKPDEIIRPGLRDAPNPRRSSAQVAADKARATKKVTARDAENDRLEEEVADFEAAQNTTAKRNKQNAARPPASTKSVAGKVAKPNPRATNKKALKDVDEEMEDAPPISQPGKPKARPKPKPLKAKAKKAASAGPIDESQAANNEPLIQPDDDESLVSQPKAPKPKPKPSNAKGKKVASVESIGESQEAEDEPSIQPDDDKSPVATKSKVTKSKVTKSKATKPKPSNAKGKKPVLVEEEPQVSDNGGPKARDRVVEADINAMDIDPVGEIPEELPGNAPAEPETKDVSSESEMDIDADGEERYPKSAEELLAEPELGVDDNESGTDNESGDNNEDGNDNNPLVSDDR